jgi:16S rRNA (cytidine1402-2'-O)-methyltransferase
MPVSGTLYIVATPIGNLGDMTPRAIDTLNDVDLIAAEDTRHSGKLLHHFGITTSCIAYHEHNESQLTPKLVQRLQQGEKIALISDAGTPLVSDPGFHLVRAARAAGVRVVPVVGASAMVAALSVSGLPSDRFCFEGFLPAKAGPRRTRLEALAAETRTLIFYESTHRIRESLAAMAEVFGAERRAVITRELTKTFETVLDGTLAQVAERLEQEPEQRKGEFVVLLHGAEAPVDGGIDAETQKVLTVLMEELPLKQAAALAARISGARKNDLYRLALRLAGDE